MIGYTIGKTPDKAAHTAFSRLMYVLRKRDDSADLSGFHEFLLIDSNGMEYAYIGERQDIYGPTRLPYLNRMYYAIVTVSNKKIVS